MGKKRASDLTPRQREWLDHLRRAGRAGESVRAYAKRHGLSELALYQATKALRRKGVLAPTGRVSRKVAAPGAAVVPARFVEVQATRPAGPVEMPRPWRARLPNGVVIEGAGELGGVLEALHRL
jgi:DNA-binding Lrp family transcriptional regulator